MQRDHFENEIKLVARAGGKFRPCPMFDGQQANEIHRVIGGRIPLREAMRLDAVEPAPQPVRRQRRLFASGAARGGEDGVWQIVAGEQLAGVEAEDVVFAPEPHDVIARLVHPVAIAEDRGIDARPHVRRQPIMPPIVSMSSLPVATIASARPMRQAPKRALKERAAFFRALMSPADASGAISRMKAASMTRVTVPAPDPRVILMP